LTVSVKSQDDFRESQQECPRRPECKTAELPDPLSRESPGSLIAGSSPRPVTTASYRRLDRQPRFERQALRQRQLDSLDDRALGEADGLSRLRDYPSRERLGVGVEAGAGDYAQDEAVAVGGLRVDRVASEDHAHRNARRHVAR